MNKSAINITLYIIKYISSFIIAILILLCSNILSNIPLKELSDFFQSATDLLHNNFQTVSIVLLICFVLISISSAGKYFLKNEDENIELSEINETLSKKLKKCDDNYCSLEKGLEHTEKDFFITAHHSEKEISLSISKISKNLIILQNELEKRKIHYFYTNKKFYKSVQQSLDLDRDTINRIKKIDENI